MKLTTVLKNILQKLLELITALNKKPEFKLLWTNPKPTSTFAPQNVNMDLSEYDMFMVRCRYSTSAEGEFGEIVEKNIPSRVPIVSWENYAGYRIIKFTDSQIQFGKCVYAMTDNQNAYCVPTRIYGIKLGGGTS